MRFLKELLTRNLRLKLIALLGACAMWVGVVYASNPPQISTFDVVPQAGPLKSGLVLLHPLNPVPIKVAGIASNVRHKGVADHLFAQVDLSQFKRPGEYQASVHVQSTDNNVFIWSYPDTIPVVVDKEVTRTIPLHVVVEQPPPAGYTASTTVSPTSVTVSGPESVLQNIQAEARVSLANDRTSLVFDPSPVTLLNTDGLREHLGLTPATARVTATITSQTTERELPIKPTFAGSGQLPSGYQLTGLSPVPLTVSATGPASVLAALTHVLTAPIDISHLTSSESVTVALEAPSGVSLSTSYVTVVLTVTPLATPSPQPTPSPTP